MPKVKRSKSTWIWETRLLLVKSAADDESLFQELGRAIGASVKRIKETPDDEWVFGSEFETIEGRLGMAFIGCQLDITGTVSRYQKLHGLEPKLGPAPKRKDFIVRANALVSGTEVRAVAAIDGFANCFKHEDEWPDDWNIDPEKNRLAYQTKQVVEALGAQAESASNMRTGFEKIIGHRRYERVSELAAIIRKWIGDLNSQYETELKRKNLM